LLQAVYSTLQLFVLEGSFERSPDCALLELARFLAPASTFGSVVTAFLLAFELQAKRRNVGRLRDHVVLCGLGPWGVALARELRAAGKAVVVLTLDRSASHVAEVEALGAAVFEGDSSSARSLRLVGADKAAYVLAITDDSAVNYRVAEQLRTMDGHPTVYVHTPDVSSMELLLGESEHAFNAYELAARQLLEDVALDGHAGIRSDEPHGHVVLAFMGFGVMSEAILVHAARTMHLANGERLRARVYSCDADVLKRLVSNHPHINAVCSVSHVAVSPKDSALFSDLEQLEQAPGARVSIIVELDDDVQSLAAAVRCERSTNDAQVLVRVDELGGSGVVATDARRLRVFGRPDTYCTWEAILDGEDGVLLQRAKASHQAYLDSLDDTGEERPAQRPWERLHREYRTANIRRAIAAPIQWRALGRGPEGSPAELTASECRTVAQMEHARWLHDKMLDGWTWGEARDPARRKSPALVAWDKLPEPERKRQTNEAATLVDIMKIGGAEPGGSGG